MDKDEYLKMIKAAIGNSENERAALEKSEDTVAKGRARASSRCGRRYSTT